ncbi:sensor histidine kinase [Caldimonas brevitalea]|uniref:histidine kinase n=1 Tax=Caldimonas brevitalea TaxID=413882 RepID=A0A0G3BQS0_9BURK|nr:ATP-binding protein [Caldimonas brevitalea]AKJ28890.1 histidine kinase [Caldimonas brevitalea]
MSPPPTSPTPVPPPTAAPQTSGFAQDALLSTGQWNAFDRSLGRQSPTSRWLGWRLRLLVTTALLGCLGVFFLAYWLAQQPLVGAAWRLTGNGQVELNLARDPLLKPAQGKTLEGLAGRDGKLVPVDGLALQRSARWLIDDVEGRRYLSTQRQLGQLLQSEQVQLRFSDGTMLDLRTHPRGFMGLGLLFWLLCSLALVVYGVAMAVLLARPNRLNSVYAVMACCQAANLVFIAVESTLDLAWPLGLADWDYYGRVALDLVTAAAVVHATAVYPRKVAHAGWWLLPVWVATAALVVLTTLDWLPAAWWWVQGACALLGMAAIALLTWSHGVEPHPFALVLRRFGIIAVTTWVLLSIAVAMARGESGVQQNISIIGSMIWYVFFASLLLLIPFLSKSQQMMREFSLLAAITTVATSLDLLFVATFSLGQVTSVTLALFVSLGLYVGARQWLLDRLMGSSVATTERMFEQLYKIAREVEARPDRTSSLLTRLLRELFEPLEILVVDKLTARSRVVADGSTLVVPVPNMVNPQPSAPTMGSIVIRFAHRGRKLFTAEDARLTDRIFEQLRRAVAFDKAVEQGRSEERMRLAQDLHDDIGARLLTLMYQAQSPEMEDYIRHTLQDLKTLTRGLAAQNHHLSDAAAEWKSDLVHRLNAAECELTWNVGLDRNVPLGVVQWSALTRVLRELANNAIAHSRATRVDVAMTLHGDRFELVVRDNGIGKNPASWSHGLGLGGIRKRVKQLGGEVEWREVMPQGIECRVFIAKFKPTD